jgi:hypothetical protein
MYTIAQELKLNALQGTVVQQICFSLNTVCIYFEDKGYIQINSSFIIKSKDIVGRYDVYPITCDNGLLQILEKKVIKICADENKKNLILEFEEGISLELINDELYESFTVSVGGITTII